MEKAWQVVGMLVVLAVIGTAIAFLVAPHKVDGYYLSRGNNNASGSVCVYAHWTWHADELAFCTDDYEKALEFTTQANQSAK